MPKISEVHVECPWVPLARATTIRLTGFAALLEKRRAFRVIGAVGDFDLSAAFTQPALTTLRIFPRQLKGGSIERIGRMGAEDLRVLQLGLADDAGTDVAAEAAVFKLPFVHLDELSVCGVVDVAATIQRFVAAGRQLPKHVRLDGGGKDDAALRAALAAWTAKTGSASQLSLGENVLRTIDDKTREALETASVGTFASPFEPQQRDEKVRELWQVLASRGAQGLAWRGAQGLAWRRALVLAWRRAQVVAWVLPQVRAWWPLACQPTGSRPSIQEAMGSPPSASTMKRATSRHSASNCGRRNCEREISQSTWGGVW